MTTKKRRLQLVPYTPDNYSPGEVLALDDATILESDKSIGAALSLYFQWEKKRSAHIIYLQVAGMKAEPCEMDFDRDEASPTEIQVRLRKGSFKIVPGSKALIRFEIFRVTYEFVSTVTAVSSDPRKEGWHSIIEVPTQLRVLKTRHLPRIRVGAADRKKLPKVSWQFAKDAKARVPLKILEFGMGSVRAACSFTGKEKRGLLRFGNAKIPTSVVRSGDGEIVLKLNFKDHQDFGTYWDYYRLVAYPSMRSRYEVPYEKGIELYERTNYFDTSHPQKTKEQISEIFQTWDDLKSGAHRTNTDYYVTNGTDLSGASSVALTNYSGDDTVWFFHQLCAVKNPKLIRETGTLYTWRAEYLLSRPERLIAVSNFRSQSRWLERIYVKHASNRKESKVWPVNNRRCTFFVKDEDDSSKIPIKEFAMGKSARVSTLSKNIWGCANPTYLSANEHLDTVIDVFESSGYFEVEQIAIALAKRLKKKELAVDVLFSADYKDSRIDNLPSPSDRFTSLPKSDLFVFISSVEHSIAVTEAKFLRSSSA